jgi:hypothetical protein
MLGLPNKNKRLKTTAIPSLFLEMGAAAVVAKERYEKERM